jgi:hypothetical protein
LAHFGGIECRRVSTRHRRTGGVSAYSFRSRRTHLYRECPEGLSRIVHISSPCHAERSEIVQGQSHAAEASPPSPPAPLLPCHPERNVSVRRTVTRSRGTPSPSISSSGPSESPLRSPARRPIFRVLCDSTNPTLRNLPRVSRLREGSKPSCTPARPVMLSEVELSEGKSTQPKHPYPRPRGVGDFSFS